MAKKALDTVSGKARRGRPPQADERQVLNRSDHYRYILQYSWPKLWPALSMSRSVAAAEKAFRLAGIGDLHEFVPDLLPLVLEVIREPKFPKRPEPQANFLADSLAARGRVSPRRSRDLCEQARRPPRTRIVRYEYFVECTCGYKGHSLNHGCPKCQAPIAFPDTSL